MSRGWGWGVGGGGAGAVPICCTHAYLDYHRHKRTKYALTALCHKRTKYAFAVASFHVKIVDSHTNQCYRVYLGYTERSGLLFLLFL